MSRQLSRELGVFAPSCYPRWISGDPPAPEKLRRARGESLICATVAPQWHARALQIWCKFGTTQIGKSPRCRAIWKTKIEPSTLRSFRVFV